MKPFCPVFLAAIGLIQAPGRAEELPESAAPTNRLVITSDFIAQLMSEAQTNNPGQLAADSRAQAAAVNVESVRTWQDPVFTFGGNVFSPEGFDPSQNGDLLYGVQEKLPLWGMPKLNRHVAEAQASVQHTQRDFHFQQLRRDVAKQLFATALTEREVQIGEQDLAWLELTAKEIEAKYQAGQSSVADTLQIQNEVAERNDALKTDRLMLDHEQVALNRLLNRKFDSPWPSLQLPGVFPTIPYSEKLVSLALTNEPQIKVLEQQIKAADAAAKLTSRSRLPDVYFGVQGLQYHSGDGGFREGMFTLSFSLPWFNESKYHKDYQRDQDTKKAAEQDRDDQVLMVREALHRLALDMENQQRAALLYRDEITPRAEQALSNRLADWRVGHITLREVLDLRRDTLDAQLMAARSTSDEYQTLAELLLWTGWDNFESLAPLANEPAIFHHAGGTEK